MTKCPCERVDHRLLEPVRGRIGKVVSGGKEWYEVVGWGNVMMLLGCGIVFVMWCVYLVLMLSV